MLPIRLSIKDFCSHSFTEFYFDDFQSALIIGRVRDNDRFSNGSGKSTIFNAIEYVLFNESHFSTLDKVIRDGCDVCRVEFDFYASMDKEVYRIVRSNSRKTGTDVRLFRQINNDWKDLTQRRVGDSEKEIIKILGFNYKAFCASVLFSQAGSENSAQRDFGNLPALTPEKRKSVLREVLQLNIYNNYEKLAKNKQEGLLSLLEKEKIVLSTLGDPDVILLDLAKESIELDHILIPLNKELEEVKFKLNTNKSICSVLTEKASFAQSKQQELRNKEILCQEQIHKYTATISDYKNKIGTLPEDTKFIKEKIENLTAKLEYYQGLTFNSSQVKDDINIVTEKILGTKSTIHTILEKLSVLNRPITEAKVCFHCHQIISEDHKHNWLKKSQDDIKVLHFQKMETEEQYKKLLKEKDTLEQLSYKISETEKNVVSLKHKIILLNNDLENKIIMYKNSNALLEEHIVLIQDKNIELQSITNELLGLTSDNGIVAIFNQLEELKFKISNLSAKEQSLSNQVNALSGKQAIIQHRIEQCEISKNKISALKFSIQELEKSIFLHAKVVQAFGSGGIPYLITHSVLDELQEETNKWLMKLRPGLQLQFVSGNKDQDDKLELLYFIDGNQREYKQLSGAQKIVVSLSIKLSLLFVMNKRLGINIKLLLLDEADQSLDSEGVDIFLNIIKIIQKEIKVLIITHNDLIKHKFLNTILVEQDENNISKGRLYINKY